jgi:NTP pyrophosphatase (non-canonical NTP hydrolase)
MDLKTLSARLAEFRDERGWQRFHNPKDLALALSVEATELLECFLWSSPAELTHKERLAMGSEAADILFYLLFFCDAAGIDLTEAAEAKFHVNKIRFPPAECRKRGLVPPIEK